MNSALFARMHGGTTHFPIGLVIASLIFDVLALVVKDPDHQSGLRAAGFYSLQLGALSSFAAVLSGLLLTHGDLMGSGKLAKHHLFLWPAFAMIVGMAVWRMAVRDRASRKAYGVYLALTLTASCLMAAAGYWGGEILLGG
ncbi:hypothetical protein CCAX7_64400 [Capsulimonas corticalis]|uniref:Uncharacterized protein n=1 Tax=Capsulimonas corticalis TaxID=2219043 RepID=A0A402CQU7_9BACT|nr:DUF2231 domain-containing protein [Capsulimonas corticalis]BDI34389.1 hypothetical protein CCAX7_64400 [Capsulimonas corticalis]